MLICVLFVYQCKKAGFHKTPTDEALQFIYRNINPKIVKWKGLGKKDGEKRRERGKERERGRG